MAQSEFLKRKEQAVLKDLESAFAGYQRLVTQVNSIRTWTVTLMAASCGFLLTRSALSPEAAVVTAGAALIAFLVLELRERSSMHFNKVEVLQIQGILMLEDQSAYEDAISQYEFRDLRLRKLTRAQKLSHLVRSCLSWQIVVWYGLWILALVLAYFFSNFKIVPWPQGEAPVAS